MHEIIGGEGDVKPVDSGLSKLSIRLGPDGLSFSTEEENDNGGVVVLEILTAGTVLVPVEAYVPECKEKYFEACSRALSAGEMIAEIPCGDSVALAAVDGRVLETVMSRYGGRLRITCPFAQEPPKGTEIRVTAVKGCSFVTLFYQGKLLCAEALPVDDFPSLLFFVNRLTVSNKLGKVAIVCAGENGRTMAEKFSDYYTEVATVCE